MATRFYLPNLPAAPVSPAFDGAWEQTGQADRAMLVRKLLLSATDAIATKSVTAPITTTQDVLSRQFVSEPLRPQVISGTVSIVVLCDEESGTNINASIMVIVKLVSQDGQTVRGTLFSQLSGGTEYPSAAVTNSATRIISAGAISSLTAQAGDRIVVEMGHHLTAPTSAGTAIHSYGTNGGSDFALTSGLTTNLNPWVEFSQDLWGGEPNNYQSLSVPNGMSVTR